MAAKMTNAQRDEIVRRLANRESHAAIAAAVGCSTQNVEYHAKKRKPLIQTVRDAVRKSVTTTGPVAAMVDALPAADLPLVATIIEGLAEPEGRIRELVWLYSGIRTDLAEGLYGTDIRMSARGETVEVPTFKTAQIVQARGALDDLAKETGGRRANSDVTLNVVTKALIGVDLEQI